MDVREGILGQMNQDGWGGLDFSQRPNDQQMQAMMAAAREEADIAFRALSTPDGQRFLNWLLLQTLFLPMGQELTQCQTADRYMILSNRREGHHQVAWMILHALQVARGEQPKVTP